jgi:hypothetical protein
MPSQRLSMRQLQEGLRQARCLPQRAPHCRGLLPVTCAARVCITSSADRGRRSG